MRNVMCFVIAVLLITLFVLGCTGSSPYGFPNPTILPGGQQGFGMRGIIQFTSSEEKAKDQISQILIRACKGPIRFHLLKLNRFDNIVGVPHFLYNVVAECEQRATDDKQ